VFGIVVEVQLGKNDHKRYVSQGKAEGRADILETLATQ
jgi:hypothetical protein